MKKVALLFATACLWSFAQAQESVIKTSGLDAAFGKYEISYERTFNEGMNNIKSSGKTRKQGNWPNILTKSSFQVSFAFINHTHSQKFGSVTAVIDTNSNHHPNYNPAQNIDGTWVDPNNRDIRINDDPSSHSLERMSVAKTSGFAFEGEYRSYFKTYSQNIGDAPRGWYIAPFARIQMTTLDFDDNTLKEVNDAMNYLMYPYVASFQDNIFGNYAGPWEGGEEQTDINAVNYGEINQTGAIQDNKNAGNSTINSWDLSWHDVSFKQKETVIAAGLAIGRQWLFADKISLDIQIGPQYKIVTKGERVFNGNDTWNINQQINNVNDWNMDPDFDANWYLYAKYGDVYSFDGSTPDSDVATGYNGLVDEEGTAVVINAKGDDHVLKHTAGFYRELPDLTDFGKLETYRLKIRVGYAF